MENMIPVNAAAKTVERLQIDNKDIAAQIVTLTTIAANNEEVIKSLEKSAKWEAAAVQPLPEAILPTVMPEPLVKP